MARSIIIRIFISFRIARPQLLSSQDTYTVYDVTCSICSPSMAIFTLGEFGILLTIIALVYVILISIPNSVPTPFISPNNSESSFSFTANNVVSSAYLRLL